MIPEQHNLTLVLVLLVLQGRDVLVAFLHLVLAVVYLLLQAVIRVLHGLEVLVHSVFGLLQRLEVSLQVVNRDILVLHLSLEGLGLETILSDAPLLTELSCVEAFVSLSQLVDLILDSRVLSLQEVDLMVFLLDGALKISNLSLSVSLLVLKLINVALQLANSLCELLDLGLSILLVLRCLIGIVPPFVICLGLHLLLLDKHLFPHFVDPLLLLDFQLINYPPVVFPELLDVDHQLLVGF